MSALDCIRNHSLQGGTCVVMMLNIFYCSAFICVGSGGSGCSAECNGRRRRRQGGGGWWWRWWWGRCSGRRRRRHHPGFRCSQATVSWHDNMMMMMIMVMMMGMIIQAGTIGINHVIIMIIVIVMIDYYDYVINGLCHNGNNDAHNDATLWLRQCNESLNGETCFLGF